MENNTHEFSKLEGQFITTENFPSGNPFISKIYSVKGLDELDSDGIPVYEVCHTGVDWRNDLFVEVKEEYNKKDLEELVITNIDAFKSSVGKANPSKPAKKI